MALIAMTSADTEDFVSTRDPSRKVVRTPRDPDDPSKGDQEVINIDADASVFKIRSLDVFLMGYIYDNATHLTGRSSTDEVGINTRVNQTNIDTVRFGLVALPDNFRDRKGNVVPFKTQRASVNGRPYDVAHDDVINTLGLQLIGEMADEIKKISEVTPAEAKNFEGA